MTVACPRPGRHPLARALRPLAVRAAPDAELVARFAADRCEPAFAELVRRHGPLVLAACRHATRHDHDADDAFQATFLVLAKKAHTLDPGRPLAAWLRGVAVRAGRKAAARRGRWSGAPLPDVPQPHPGGDAEAVAAVRAAVAALPAHQRQAVERCELLGRPRAEVARELGVPAGTLSSRLALARRALAARLRRQGFAPVSVPPALLAAAKATASEVSSPRVTLLAEAVMRTTWHGWAAALIGAVAVATAGGLASAPAPMPRPAAEPVTDEGLLLLWCGPWESQSLVWIDPDGRRPATVTAAQARAAGADLRLSLVSTKRSQFDWVDDLALAGVPRPNGEVPIQTRTGAVLLTPTNPPVVRLLTPATGDVRGIVGWTPDGRRAVVGDEAGDYQLLDTVTGERTPLAVPAGHRVWGWSPAGDWLLTRPTGRKGMWLERLFKSPRPDAPVFRVGRDGVPQPLLGGEHVEYPVLSPDGRRLLFHTKAMPDKTVNSLAVTVWAADLDGGNRVALGVHPVAMCMGLVWSPDGSRVAYEELRFPVSGGVGVPHLWVCDADGGNRREVTLPAGAADGRLLAWR